MQIMSEKKPTIYYFDHAATTALDPRVLAAMEPYLTANYGNPSALYSVGKAARQAVEKARARVAELLHAQPNEIYFTSGGSESDNTAIKGLCRTQQTQGKHLVTSAIEHPAVRESAKQLAQNGWQVTYLPVSEDGVVQVDEAKRALTDDTALISVMMVNNEVGTIQPIVQLAQLARERQILMHTDAVQAAGCLELDVDKLGVDSLSVSAHKFYGPKGVGVLYLREGVTCQPLIAGGHQERGLRAGTENVAGIVGLAEAWSLAHRERETTQKHIKQLRDYYEQQVRQLIPNIIINGEQAERVAGISNICFRRIEGEGLVLLLDLQGICAATGSACSNLDLEPSHVLLAMGRSHEVAHGSLRVSIGKDNTREEIDYLLKHLMASVEKLRAMSPLS